MEPEIVTKLFGDIRAQLEGFIGLAGDLIALIDRLVVLVADLIRSGLSFLRSLIAA